MDFEENSNKTSWCVYREKANHKDTRYSEMSTLGEGSAAPKGGLSPGLSVYHLRAHPEALGVQMGAEDDVDPITLGITQGPEPRVGI